MTEQLTTLETVLQRIVNEADPVARAELADQYAAELRVLLRSVSSRAQSVIWKEKDDILGRVDHVLDVLKGQNDQTLIYRETTVETLRAVNQKLNDYIAALPPEERTRLVAQIADHELRITALEDQDNADKS